MQILLEEVTQEVGLQKSDIAAVASFIGVNALSGAGANAAFSASELCTEHGKHHPVATGCASIPDGSQTSQPTEVRQHDRTGPEDSHGCKLGRSRIDYGLGLTLRKASVLCFTILKTTKQ